MGAARGVPNLNAISLERQALTNILVLRVRESSNQVLFQSPFNVPTPVQFLPFANGLPLKQQRRSSKFSHMEVDPDSQEEEALIIYGCINVGEAELRGRVLLLFPMI